MKVVESRSRKDLTMGRRANTLLTALDERDLAQNPV